MYKSPLLLIMRHAKSVPAGLWANDFERPLDATGQKQPKKISTYLKEHAVEIDAAVVSPSARTRETWASLNEGLKSFVEPLFDSRLYEASCDNFIQVVLENAHNDKSLLVIGHCPSVNEAVLYLTGEHADFRPADLFILRPHDGSFDTAFHRRGQFYLVEKISAHD